MLDAVTFRDTITLGSVVFGILVGLPGLIGLLYGAKWKAASDVAEETAKVAEQGRAVYKQAAERLGAEKDAANEQVAVLQAELEQMRSYPFGDQVAELVAKTLDRLDALGSERTRAAAAMLAKQHEEIEARMVEAFELHERRAQERHDAQMELNQAMLRALTEFTAEAKRTSP